MATIEIDGKTIETANGKTIIEVADEAGIYIPRFCYHKKLSVAANCRMCLVEVEKSRKPLPACATPITDGMRVFTKSEEAIRSQKAVMEFLLINHPLDCPICDQGGECELQDISMGFGSDASIYEETKRSFDDDDLGSLIETEMTRCIQCTRCVRFGDEIAGVSELGATSRGERMQIGTYVNHSMTSEVSGNIIDLCPVGALTSKPYRYTARPWELTQTDNVAIHDCLGTNIHVHVRRNDLMRVVPKENEQINETWISDRDRFSYLGVNSQHRAIEPLIKRNGQWEAVEWEVALKFAADGIARIIKEHGAEQFAAFASPSATLEEFYLLQKLMRALGVNNLDHRLQQTDFRDGATQPLMPQNSLNYAAIDQQQQIILIGCNIHREVPLAGLRVRKAFTNGAKVYAINSVDYDYHFAIENKIIISPQNLPQVLAQLVKGLADKTDIVLPAELVNLIDKLNIDDKITHLVEVLSLPNTLIITGALFENHPDAALLRTLCHWLEKLSGVKKISLTSGANSAGAWLSGMVPHRSMNEQNLNGLDIQQSLNARLKGYLLLGIDTNFDCANPYNARRAMLGADFVVSISGFQNDSIKEYADVILPMGLFAETSGTYINLDNNWQTVKGALAPAGSARPAWKILRVLANLLQIEGFDYFATTEILDEIKVKADLMPDYEQQYFYPEALPVEKNDGLVRLGEWPLYRSDAIVRHARALQKCASADTACVKIHPITAEKLKLKDTATVSQGDIEITLPLKLDERIALDVVWVPNAMAETMDLGYSFAAITVRHK